MPEFNHRLDLVSVRRAILGVEQFEGFSEVCFGTGVLAELVVGLSQCGPDDALDQGLGAERGRNVISGAVEGLAKRDPTSRLG